MEQVELRTMPNSVLYHIGIDIKVSLEKFNKHGDVFLANFGHDIDICRCAIDAIGKACNRPSNIIIDGKLFKGMYNR